MPGAPFAGNRERFAELGRSTAPDKHRFARANGCRRVQPTPLNSRDSSSHTRIGPAGAIVHGLELPQAPNPAQAEAGCNALRRAIRPRRSEVRTGNCSTDLMQRRRKGRNRLSILMRKVRSETRQA